MRTRGTRSKRGYSHCRQQNKAIRDGGRKEKVLDFGENKVQEIRDKYANISWPVRWHLIGHLQTNKIKYIVDKVALIHSVDSVKLAQAIDKEAVKHNGVRGVAGADLTCEMAMLIGRGAA